MRKDDIINLLISEYPQVQEAFNWTEEVEDRVWAEELYATMDELYASKRAAGILEEAVETAVTQFIKTLSNEINLYERNAIR